MAQKHKNKPESMPVRIELDRLENLRKIADRDKCSVASVIRRAIEQFLERENAG
jgi:hypothetical protein